MVPPAPAPAAGSAALPDSSASTADAEPSRPEGVGLIALLLAASNTVELLWALLHLWAGTPTPTLQFVQLTVALVCALEFFVVFHFWKGKNWARILVLLPAFFFAAQSLSLLVDHNLDPTALMRDPVRFLRALLSIFLLYWLNTPALRAWFKKISSTQADLIAARLVGKLCTAVDVYFPALDLHSPALDLHSEAAPADALYRLTFEHRAQLILHCPFRIVLDDNLAFAHTPAAHAPEAGREPFPQASTPVPDPSSNPADARRLLQNLRVTSVRLAPHTSDLFLTFEMGIQLQTWSDAPAARAPAAGSAHAPAAGSAHAPAAGSAALSHEPALPHAPSLQWTYSDPVLTVIARADGLTSEIVSPTPPADEHADA